MKITLKDGSVKEYAQAMSVYDIALDISEGLARAACAGEVDGEVVDLRTVVDKDCSLSILTADAICRVDNYYNFLTINKLFFSSVVIMALGFMASTISAVRHFLRVNKVKQMRKKSGHNNDNNERDTNVGNQDS